MRARGCHVTTLLVSRPALPRFTRFYAVSQQWYFLLAARNAQERGGMCAACRLRWDMGSQPVALRYETRSRSPQERMRGWLLAGRRRLGIRRADFARPIEARMVAQPWMSAWGAARHQECGPTCVSINRRFCGVLRDMNGSKGTYKEGGCARAAPKY